MSASIYDKLTALCDEIETDIYKKIVINVSVFLCKLHVFVLQTFFCRSILCVCKFFVFTFLAASRKRERKSPPGPFFSYFSFIS